MKINAGSGGVLNVENMTTNTYVNIDELLPVTTEDIGKVVGVDEDGRLALISDMNSIRNFDTYHYIDSTADNLRYHYGIIFADNPEIPITGTLRAVIGDGTYSLFTVLGYWYYSDVGYSSLSVVDGDVIDNYHWVSAEGMYRWSGGRYNRAGFTIIVGVEDISAQE